ncbi:MAG TPA: TolC family protein [Puia sp.]|uniref:TolC family protein n=1 Tax=Puia sp. TaxID=2045100 RepID=UPI002BC5D5DC|nr:TolC family protein [Puia sp.]HVU99070.1 TolC family protein [Puia sp.]
MVTFCIRKFGRAIGIFLLMPSLSVFAQQKYSLKDYVDSAQRHLPVLLQKQALVEAASAGVTDARHAFLPTSYIGDEVTAGTDNSIPGSYISFGIIPSSSSGVRSSNLYQAAIGNIGFFYNQFELLDFGLKKATVRNAQAYLGLTQADRDREAYLIKWQVAKLYLDILKSRFQLAIDQQNVSRYDTLFTVIRAVTESGIKPGADSSLAKAELSKARTTYNQTLGDIRQLQQQLSYLSGIPVDNVAIDTSKTGMYLSTLTGIGNLQPGAANPLIDFFTKEKELYLQREELVKKSFLPRVLLNGVGWARGSSIDYTNNYKSSAVSGLGYQRFNYLAGLTLEYDLFNIVHRRDKERIARNNAIASDYGLQQQQLELQNVGNKADEAIRTATKNLAEVPIQIGSATDAFNQKTAQYKAGIINVVDLTNASFVLYRSQSDYIQTLSDWLLANLDKYSSTGSLDQFIQSIK